MMDSVRQAFTCDSASVCREIAAAQQQLVAELVPLAVFLLVGIMVITTLYFVGQ